LTTWLGHHYDWIRLESNCCASDQPNKYLQHANLKVSTVRSSYCFLIIENSTFVHSEGGEFIFFSQIIHDLTIKPCSNTHYNTANALHHSII
jgi:hypothetical protein